MSVLYQNGIRITKARNLKEVLNKILESAMKLTETPTGSIALIDGDEMFMAAHTGLTCEFFKENRWTPRENGLTYRILRGKEPVEFQDTEKDPIFEGTQILKEGIRSLLASPLPLDNSVVGILYLDDFKPREFTERHKNLIKIFSSFAAKAIEKFKLLHELEESLGYLQGVLDDSQDIIVTTDNRGRIVKFSKGGSRILGYEADEVIGRKAAEFYVDREERAKILEALKEEGAVYNYETKLLKKDGFHVDISLTISRLRDKAGNIIGTVGVSKDITEERQLREKLKDKNKELEELTQSLEEKVLERTRELEKINGELRRAHEVKGRFIANMSHELRTPLHSIVGFSEVLLDRTFGDINEKQQRHVTNILTSGKHLLHLVNNILDLAKIEAGRTDISHETCSLKAVTDEVFMIVKPLADRKRIELKTDISPEVSDFTADKVKFKQVLYNLLSNAIKFTLESGQVGIRTEKLINRDLLPWAIKGQEFLKLSVWDTGVGIRAEDKERVFDEFEQLDPSKSTEGTGLGLSLTKKLVELHGGYIDVESDYGKGSTFNVYMPMSISEKYEGERPVLPEDIAAVTDEVENAPLVLVVEDDIPTSELLSIHLAKAGYRTVHAYDGIEAIEKAKEVQPFAITLDIMLPKKNGWEVLQHLKSDSETGDIPVIIHSIIDNKELGFALGAVDYIVKPLDKTNVLSRLEHISLATKKRRYPVTVLTVTDDAGIQKHFQHILGGEGFLVHSAANSQQGINLALATNPNLAIIDLNIPGGGFNLIKRFKENPATKMMPVFALTSSALSEDENLSITGQIERVLRKDALSSKELITHLRDLEVLHPKRAGLIDDTTGIFNNRYFQIRLAQETSRARRYNLPFIMAIFGIDYFTNYTNKHGEYYGNLTLRKIAELLRKDIRGSDVVVRYGSDAFALILTNTYLSSGVTLCKRLLSTIHDYPFLKEESQPNGRLTASAGILAFSGQSVEELLRSAERALLLAVEKGRNRVEVLSEEKCD
jgi:diguanylate cyclase (GGDEF)-like protein/PAS domain S-box-containing protein